MSSHQPTCWRGVTDEQLTLPTPCEKLPLDELVAHIGGLAMAFSAAARKDLGPLTDTPPTDGAAAGRGLADPLPGATRRSWPPRGRTPMHGRA